MVSFISSTVYPEHIHKARNAASAPAQRIDFDAKEEQDDAGERCGESWDVNTNDDPFPGYKDLIRRSYMTRVCHIECHVKRVCMRGKAKETRTDLRVQKGGSDTTNVSQSQLEERNAHEGGEMRCVMDIRWRRRRRENVSRSHSRMITGGRARQTGEDSL